LDELGLAEAGGDPDRGRDHQAEQQTEQMSHYSAPFPSGTVRLAPYRLRL
jgi:hypothetical protein